MWTFLKNIKDTVFNSTKKTGQFWRESRTEGKVVNIHCKYLEQSTEVGTTLQYENGSQTEQKKCVSALM